MENYKDVALKKELKAECAELVQGIYSDVLAIKLKDPSKRKKLLKRCEKLIEEVENDRQISKAAHRYQIAKLLDKCEVLLEDTNTEMSRTPQRPRKRQKRKREMGNIRVEELNIISINARGVAKKKKSIEEILKNENVDVAIISELSVKTVLKFKGYREFVEIRGHMHGICILMRNDIARHALRIHKESELEVVHVRLFKQSQL